MMDDKLTADMDFVWFQGVVENRDDPLQLGRCKVRCLGFHTHNNTQLKTEELPWAHPLQPITSAAMSGIGQTPTGPVLGTWVFGFFRDGRSAQQPVIVGTMGGIPTERPPQEVGFSDPTGVYPKEEYIGEADTNRLARGVTMDTIVQKKLENIDEMELATSIDGSDTVREPETKYSAQYPLNKVTESESGHIIEIDDTEGAERIHVYHKSGTFLEVHPGGDIVVKIGGGSGGFLPFGAKDSNINLKGDFNITVEGDSSIYTKGDATVKTDGDFKHNVTNGDYEVNVKGEIRLNAGEGGSSIKMDGTSIRENSGSIYLN